MIRSFVGLFMAFLASATTLLACAGGAVPCHVEVQMASDLVEPAYEFAWHEDYDGERARLETIAKGPVSPDNRG